MADQEPDPVPGPNREPISLIKKCIKCTREILSKESFKCCLCSSFTHVFCAPGSYDRTAISIIRANFLFLCVRCSDKRFEIGDKMNHQRNLDLEIEKVRAVHNTESHAFFRTIEQLKTNLKTEQEQNASLQRQIQMQNLAKRTRTEMEIGTMDININNQIKSAMETHLTTIINPIIDQMNKLTAQFTQLTSQFGQFAKTLNTSGPHEIKSAYNSNTGQNIKRRYFEECPKQSYAQAIANTEQSVDTIRNITLCDPNDPNKDCTIIMEKLQKNDFCAGENIKKIKAKGKCNITYQCEDVATTESVETKLKNKYKDAIIIKKVDPSKPMIKIIRIQTDIDDDLEITEQIKEQNKWLCTWKRFSNNSEI